MSESRVERLASAKSASTFLCARCGLTHPSSERGRRHTKMDLIRLARSYEHRAARIYKGLLAAGADRVLGEKL